MRRQVVLLSVLCLAAVALCAIAPMVLFSLSSRALQGYLVEPGTMVDLHETDAHEGNLLDAVEDFEKVRHVSLRANPRIGDYAMLHIARMSNLEGLNIRRCSVTDTGLARLVGLKKLKCLRLSGTAVTDEGMLTIAQMPQIEQLWLDSTAIGDVGVAHLASLSHLRGLYVENTPLTDEGAGAIAEIDTLTAIAAGYTLIGDEAVRHFARLPRI